MLEGLGSRLEARGSWWFEVWGSRLMVPDSGSRLEALSAQGSRLKVIHFYSKVKAAHS